MDILNFVLDIPSIVEGFVKTARLIVAYQGLEAKFVETLEDAIYYAEKLHYLSRFVDGAQLGGGNMRVASDQPPRWNKALQRASMAPKPAAGHAYHIDEDVLSVESQRILCDLFQKATSALEVARKVTQEWAIRLDLSDSSATRVLVAKLAISMSDWLVRSPERRKRKGVFSNTRNKLSFFALGYIQVEDATRRLKHWLAELHDILLASPKLHLNVTTSLSAIQKARQDKGGDLLFVAIAREREVRSHPLQQIDGNLSLSGRPLGNGNQELLLIHEGTFEGCLLDRRNMLHFLEHDKTAQALEDTVRMARLFAEEHDELGYNITASVGILPCCGYSISSLEYHDLVFRLPPGCPTPRTLRSLLMEEPQHTLNERLDFSIKLASAVLIVHSLGLVHKNVRPDSVIAIKSSLRQDPTMLPQTLGEPYLVAFNQSRFQGSITVPMSEGIREARSRLWKALYRHPRHLSTRQHLPFETRDDIYSLGICLLEIAIWKSLFVWSEEHGVFECDKTVLDFSANRYKEELAEHEAKTLVRPILRRRDLIKFAEERVAISMGTTFRDVIVECLTFCEETPSVADMLERQTDNQRFLQNQSVSFVQRVLTRLKSLRLR